MGTLFTKLRHTSMRSKALFAMIAVAIIAPASLLAWGPDRPTYTKNNPADHITFNSITDNSDYGDERNFVRIKDTANTNAGGWTDELTVQPGKEYWVQMYVHNNAATSLNLVANNTKVMANVPNTTGKEVKVEGFISADNATPQQIWDQAIFKSDKDFNLTYQAGSTQMYNKVFPNGTPVNDSIVTSAGALVGYDKMDGKLPGCFNYSGYVSFKVKVGAPQAANFTTSKQVSKHGQNDWKESYAAAPGETVDFLIKYKNTDTAVQNNVTIKDTLPAGLTYVPGSTLFGTKEQPGGQKASDNVTTTGINIGSYAQNGGTWVTFSAKVAASDALAKCGTNTLRNVARAETDFGYKEDTADVMVNKPCQPNTISVCDTHTKKVVTIAEGDFDSARYTKDTSACTTTTTTDSPDLPVTGVSSGVATVAGLSLFTAGIGYLATNRRVRDMLVTWLTK